jgi:hypothetical protein
MALQQPVASQLSRVVDNLLPPTRLYIFIDANDRATKATVLGKRLDNSWWLAKHVRQRDSSQQRPYPAMRHFEFDSSSNWRDAVRSGKGESENTSGNVGKKCDWRQTNTFSISGVVAGVFTINQVTMTTCSSFAIVIVPGPLD